jgi:L-iditol 2-dehydrogenase
MKTLRKMRMGKGQVEVVSVPRPAVQKDEVLIEVKYAGVCGTDLHILHDMFQSIRPPVTLGHEFSGVIAEKGPDVSNWQIGDRVTIESTASFCGQCRSCRTGDTQRCLQRCAYGIVEDGAFAKYVAVRQDALHKLPDHISFQEAALTEPLAVAIHAVLERTAISQDDTVLVTGPGPIGQLVLQVAKATGAKVIVTGTSKDEDRLNLATKLGADQVLRADRQDLKVLVEDITDGSGVDVAFESSGAAAAVQDCISATRKGADIVQIGLLGRPLELDYDQLAIKELNLRGSFTHNHQSWVKALEYMKSSKVNLKAVISDEFPIDQWQEAFQLFESGTGLKYLLYPID